MKFLFSFEAAKKMFLDTFQCYIIAFLFCMYSYFVCMQRLTNDKYLGCPL